MGRSGQDCPECGNETDATDKTDWEVAKDTHKTMKRLCRTGVQNVQNGEVCANPGLKEAMFRESPTARSSLKIEKRYVQRDSKVSGYAMQA